VGEPGVLESRLTGVRERIAHAAGRAGRDPAAIRLVAVSKTFPPEDIRAAAALGVTDFGENKVQEAQSKIDALSDLPLRWHLIGHLQANKARRAAGLFSCIHSLDRTDLLAKLDASARDAGRVIDLLVQVDLSGEPTKHGARPEEVTGILDAADACRAVHVRGLMLLPPAVGDPAEARPYFAALRAFRDDLVSRGADASALAELSMGMSHDFDVAIEEGATMVRIGTALFGTRAAR